MWRVYPRACGGTSSPKRGVNDVEGLSPRVRGNHYGIIPEPKFFESIPARAGEPPGDLQLAQLLMIKFYGLSPRVRGNHRRYPGGADQGRSIPARAGEPAAWARTPSAPTVYPRACGGTIAEGHDAISCDGLSPRVRGNRPAGTWSTVGRRSIPARAGEPVPMQLDAHKGKVYPRACGEPRPTVMPSVISRVYPRACGGTYGSPQVVVTQRGLSPRVRGNRPTVSTNA